MCGRTRRGSTDCLSGMASSPWCPTSLRLGFTLPRGLLSWPVGGSASPPTGCPRVIHWFPPPPTPPCRQAPSPSGLAASAYLSFLSANREPLERYEARGDCPYRVVSRLSASELLPICQDDGLLPLRLLRLGCCPLCSTLPQASRGGGSINISYAPCGVPRRDRPVVWKPPQQGVPPAFPP